MYTKKFLSILLFNLSFFAFCSDVKEPLIDKKDEKKTVKLDFDRHNARGYLSLLEHSMLVQRYPSIGWELLLEALLCDRQNAVDFYAQRTPLVFIMNKITGEGNIILMRKILPLLCKAPKFEVKYDADNELPARDYSGLQAAVFLTKNYHRKDEARVREIMNTIINFYTPVNDMKCIKRCCFGSCTALCQERRKAFIAHGLAKAGELAIKHDYRNIVKFIYQQHKAFPTLQAIQAADDKKYTLLAQQLTTRRTAQLCSSPSNLAQSYALLRMFNCINVGIADGRGYGEQIAWPVIKNIRYGSWLERLLCAQACPKE